MIAASCITAALWSIGAGTAGASIWSVVPAEPPTRIADSYLQGVSCSSGSACIAVGYASTGFSNDGVEGITPVVERWDGRSWALSMSQQTNPEGTGAELNAVSCSSPSACTAVGFTQLSSYEGPVDAELVERWNGSAWTVGGLSGAGDLSAVSCASARACMAVGTAISLYGAPPAAVSAQWNGKRWLAEAIGRRRGWYETTLSRVSCGSATSCLAVGYFRSGGGCSVGLHEACTREPLVEQWNGHRWAVASAPRPSGAGSVSVDEVACAKVSRCTAIGTFARRGNRSVPFAARWTGRVWISRRMPKPLEAKAVQIEGLSCTSARACTVAAGLTTNANTAGLVAERWNGSRWAIQPISQPPGAQSAILDGISCASPLDCTAVGSFTNTAGAAFPLTESRSQAIWSMQQPPSAVVVEPGTLNAVSCTSPGSCVSVGSVNGTSMTTLTLAEAWDGMTWSVQTTANPVVTQVALQVSLDAVSCASQTACTAIGGGPHDDPLLVERWDGANWTVQSTPTTSDATTLDAISCPTPTACTAVGGQSADGGQPFVEHWDGTVWAIQLAQPIGGFGGSLQAVSCTSDNACTAVGAVLENVNGLAVDQALVERWDGAHWSIQNTPTPPGSQGSGLNAVSCTSATDCTAVGQSYSPIVAPPSPLAEHWDGSAWTIEPTPIGQIGFTSVSCTSASACAAIAPPNAVDVWDGSSWAIEDLPGIAPGVALNAVSCASDRNCTVVGEANQEPFVEGST